jgi:uncharacterized membrane protein
MGSTIAVIITVVALCGWHPRTRRHPAWRVSADARFYITAGYPLVMIAVYWLMQSTSATAMGWEWALGNLWALVAVISFVYGFNSLHIASEQQQSTSRAIESIRRGAPRSRRRVDQRSSARDITTR